MTRAARLKRRVDRRFYRLLFHLFRALFPNAAPAGRLPPTRVRRLLVARTDRVGDTVVFTPALNYLRAVLPPNAEIDVVTAAGATLLAGDPRVHRVYTPGRRLLARIRLLGALRARRYDVVLSVRLRDHLDEGLAAAFVAPRGAARVSVRRPTQHAGLFTHQVRVPPSQQHVLARLLYLAQAAVGDGPAPATADLARYPASLGRDAAAEARVAAMAAAGWAGRPFVAFNAWGSDPKRCFGPALAAEIAAQIATRHPDLVVVLTPPPTAATEAAAIVQAATARLAEHTGAADAGRAGAGRTGAGRTGAGRAGAAAQRPDAVRVTLAPPVADLRDLVALLRRAAAVVTPDTANMHIASAVGTPLVAVYSSYTAVDVWGAWGDQPRQVLHVPGDQALRALPAAAVAAAFDALRHSAGAAIG